MDIRSILTIIDGDEQSQATLEAGIFLGTFFAAHLEVLHVQPSYPDVMSIVSNYGSLSAARRTYDILEEDAQLRARYAQELFQTHCVDAGRNVLEQDDYLGRQRASITWRKIVGHVGIEIAHQGRLSDLIVMACPGQQAGGIDSSILETTLFDSGRPVIIVGANYQACAGGRIAIAWDGSRESAHSVGLAIPFLKQAKKILILTVGKPISTTDPQTLARYLSLHGIEAEPRFVEDNSQSVAEVLLAEAEQWNSNLLVMGAYGHNAFLESVVGGVTRTVLERTSLPVFMAH